MRIVSLHQAFRFGLLIAAASIALPISAHAQLTSDVIFRVGEFSQTDAVTTTLDGYFFSAREFMTNPTDFDGGTLTYPGPASPASYAPITDSGGSYLNYQSGLFPDLPTLNANFPIGTYQTTATNSSTSSSQTTTLIYTLDAYSQTIPALAPASYSALQGASPSQSITVNFSSPFLPDPNANEADVFFSITDASNNTVFDESFLPSSTTSITIPAATLAPSTSYTYDLIYSDRINGTDVEGLPNTQGFDYTTFGNFTTGAVPEPASLSLLVLAAPALLSRRSRR